MTIALSPETTRLIEQHLATGSYRSADELVQAAITAFAHHDDDVDLTMTEEDLDAIDEAEDQIDRGEGIDWSTVRDSFLKQCLEPPASPVVPMQKQ